MGAILLGIEACAPPCPAEAPGPSQPLGLAAAAAEPPAPDSSAPAEAAHGGGHHGPHHAGHHGGAAASGPLVHRFEDPEKWAERFEGPERDAWQKPAALVAALDLEPGMAVADVGAGTGYLLPHLSPAVGPSGRVYAVDVEPSMVSYLLERASREGLANVVPQLATVNDPMLPPESLDRVVFVDVWHHVPERSAYATRVVRSLRPGAKLVVVDFKLDSPRGPKRPHKLPPEEVTVDLEAAGLAVTVDTDTLPDQYIAVGTKAR